MFSWTLKTFKQALALPLIAYSIPYGFEYRLPQIAPEHPRYNDSDRSGFKRIRIADVLMMHTTH